MSARTKASAPPTRRNSLTISLKSSRYVILDAYPSCGCVISQYSLTSSSAASIFASSALKKSFIAPAESGICFRYSSIGRVKYTSSP